MAGASRGVWGVVAAASALGALGYWTTTTSTAFYGPLGIVQSSLRNITGYVPTTTAQAPANSPANAQTTGAPGTARAPGQPQGRPPVSVSVARADKRDMPVRIEAIGTVQAIATVNIRPRVDSQIIDVAFEDGAKVKQGDLLFKLDARQIEALIAQAEANVAKDKASLVAAEADLRRAMTLAQRDFGTEQRIDTSRALVDGFKASIRSGEAQVDNLKVQRSFLTINAPITGRVGVASLKSGSIAKAGDGSTVLVTINQISPIYVSFAVPQRHLPEIRTAIQTRTAKVIATPQGFSNGSTGTLAVVDNAVDAQTGTITIRASFENADELLWPGALCQVVLTLRTEKDAISVAREAIQPGQQGTFVFAVEDGVARVKPVTVDRIVDGRSVISSGLNGSETVVIDGGQLLAGGSRVAVRGPGGNQPASVQPPRTAPTAGGAPTAPAGTQPQKNRGSAS
jgi:membrane fusion protein, multidrug efflux system